MSDSNKPQARIAIQSRLDALSEHDFLTRSRLAQENLIILLKRIAINNEIKTVLLFKPVLKWREIDAPYIVECFESIHFDYVPVRKNAPFLSTKYDIVLVPLYGFTKDGYRLGHGNSWYDRFFTKQPHALRIGIGLEANLIEFSVEPHDVAMDCIVTESRLEILQKRSHPLKTLL